jgi:ABC-2 type transport system permease protein
MLAVLDAGAPTVAGYNEPQLVTFVWAGQGLIGLVLLWAPLDLAERIRSGDVVTDLLRPIDPVWQMLAADLGRAGYAAVTRFVGLVAAGALLFELYAPRHALDGTTTAGDLVSRLAELAALRDISVLEPAIEDVVARLYTRRRG